MESSGGVDHPVEGSTTTLGLVYPGLGSREDGTGGYQGQQRLQMQRGLDRSLVQARDKCGSDVTAIDLSCWTVNVFCFVNLSHICCNCRPKTTFLLGGMV